MKDIQTRKAKLEQELKEVSEIAKREPAANATFSDAYNDADFPPYFLSILAFESYREMAEDLGEGVADKTESGRIRGKGEKAILNGLCKVGEGFAYASGGFMAACAAVLTTPISLPRLGFVAGKSAVNSAYNKRIEKAKKRVAEIKNELTELDKQEAENAQAVAMQ